MADNTVLNSGSGGDTIRTKDRTTYKTPISILDQGAASESLVDSTNPLYTQLRSEQVDDAAFTAATSRIAVVGFLFDNSAPDSVDEGDGGAARMSANRCVYVNIRDNAGNERGLNIDASGLLGVTDGGGSITVDGTVAATQSGAWDIGTVTAVTSITNALPAGNNNIGDVDIASLPATSNAGATAKTTDYDTGAGTDTVTMFGIALPASGGAVAGGTSSNPVRTDPTGTTTQPVSGTVAATQSGGWSVTVSGTATVDTELPAAAALADNTANPTAPAVGAFVQLWDGATWDRAPGNSTDGLLVNLGTNNDITVTGNVTVVQATASNLNVTEASAASILTSVQLIDDSVNTDGAAAGTKLLFVGGTDGTNAQILSVNSSGHVNIADGGNVITVDGTGTFVVQIDGSALTSLQKIDDPVLVDDAAFTPATSSVMMAGFQADETGTDSVDEGDAGAARMTLDRKVIVTPQPHTKGGLSIFRSLDLDETEEDVKTAAGQVYGAWVTNFNASTRYLKFYNATAANVIVGTTTPVITIAIPGNTSDDISAILAAGGYGIEFDTAICVAATTGLADADTGAPSANDVLVNIFYK